MKSSVSSVPSVVKVLIFALLVATAAAQVQQPTSTRPTKPNSEPPAAQPAPTAATPVPAPIAAAPDLPMILSQVERTAQATTLDLARLRIEKWKADGGTKQQMQSNAQSAERNLTSALPGLVQQARASSQSLAPQFKLYRNLNALYDVLAGLAESAGAFGPREEFDRLGQDVAALDQARRLLADRLERDTAQRDAELDRWRTAARAAAAAPPTPPKKIIVDDSEPQRPAPKKKKPSPQ